MAGFSKVRGTVYDLLSTRQQLQNSMIPIAIAIIARCLLPVQYKANGMGRGDCLCHEKLPDESAHTAEDGNDAVYSMQLS